MKTALSLVVVGFVFALGCATADADGSGVVAGTMKALANAEKVYCGSIAADMPGGPGGLGSNAVIITVVGLVFLAATARFVVQTRHSS